MNASDAGAERAFYLEAFNGDGGYTFDRIGRGTVRIESTTVALIGGIQPSKLAPLVRGAASGQADDGLIQRLQLAVWPDLSVVRGSGETASHARAPKPTTWRYSSAWMTCPGLTRLIQMFQ